MTKSVAQKIFMFTLSVYPLNKTGEFGKDTDIYPIGKCNLKIDIQWENDLLE